MPLASRTLRAGRPPAPRQYKYFICYTNWNICSIDVGNGKRDARVEQMSDHAMCASLRAQRNNPEDRRALHDAWIASSLTLLTMTAELDWPLRRR
jgi:hypothetical protein